MIIELFGREITVGNLFLLNVSMWLTLGLVIQHRLLVLWRLGLSWRQDDPIVVAIAWFVYMTGVMIDRGGTWWTLHADAAGSSSDISETISLVGLPIAIVGGLCCMRVLSRRSWGHWIWISAGTISLVAPWMVRWFI